MHLLLKKKNYEVEGLVFFAVISALDSNLRAAMFGFLLCKSHVLKKDIPAREDSDLTCPLVGFLFDSL